MLVVSLSFFLLYHPVSTYHSNPDNNATQYLFGRLDLSNLTSEQTYPLNVDTDDDDFNSTGVSLSFYLDPSVSSVFQNHTKILTLFGSDILFLKNATGTGEVCYLSVITQYKVNVTYTLEDCDRKHIYLDLYPSTGRVISMLYENFKPLMGEEEKGWCQYNSTFLKESDTAERDDFSYESTTNSLDDVKEICLQLGPAYTKSESIDGERCRGITLMQNGYYTLRPGDLLQTSKASNSDEITYMNGPCIDTNETIDPLTPEVTFYKTETPLELSHINIDKLANISESAEQTKRYKRVELGSMVVGNYLNFADLSYNLPFKKENISLDFLRREKIKDFAMSSFSLNEGSIIQEDASDLADTGHFIDLYYGDHEYSATFIWIASNVLYIDQVYCKREEFMFEDAMKDSNYSSLDEAYANCDNNTGCWGILQTDDDYCLVTDYTGFKSSAENTIWYKGFCMGDNTAGTEDHRITETALANDRNTAEFKFITYIELYVFYFRSLPEGHGEFEANGTGSTACSFMKGNTAFTNDLDAVFTFKTPENAFRAQTWKTENKSDTKEESLVYLNATDEQYYIYRMTLGSDVQIISLGDMTFESNQCELIFYTQDICDAAFKEDNYGIYYVDRLKYVDDSYDIPCSASNDSTGDNVSWACKAGSLEATSTCPFYQCLEEAGRTHDPLYVDDSIVPTVTLNGEEDGTCCGGSWQFVCQDNYTVNYTGCSEFPPCDGTEELEFIVPELDSITKTVVQLNVSTSIPSNSEVSVDCEHSGGSVSIRCTKACSAQREVLNNTCGGTFCLSAGVTKTLQLGLVNKKPVYGKFNKTLEGPMQFPISVVLPCQHGGNVSLECYDGEITSNYENCVKAPTCPEDTTSPPLIVSVTFNEVYATETDYQDCDPGTGYCYNNASRTWEDCSTGNAGTASRYCDSNGTWEEPDYNLCPLQKCSNEAFSEQDIAFSTGETKPGDYSSTTCSDPMCNANTCGKRLCNATSGGYDDPDYSSCQFNCTEVNLGNISSMEHRTHTSFSGCLRANSEVGKKWVTCKNNNITTSACLLVTCSYEGGDGCIDMDTDSLQQAETTEIVNDFAAYLDNVDFTSEEAVTGTRNVVNTVLSRTSSEFTQEDKTKIAAVIDKVAINLAKTGGSITSDSVNMFGVPSESADRRKRNSDENTYLVDNGINGTGFNGSIGISVYSSTDLFTPKTATDADGKQDSLDSSTVKSITTEYNSSDVDITIEFERSSSYNDSDYQCRYYNTTGDWSSDGCNIIFSDGLISCRCTHLTSFAVLVSLTDVDDEAQSLATEIMLTMAVICLLATILAIIPFKKLRSRDIMKIHLNLIVSNMIASLSFLCLDFAAGRPTLCHVFTFITHFAWLSVFGWMIGEGVTMYRQTVQALKSYGKKVENYVLKLGACVYGGALIFPIIGIILSKSLEDFDYIREDDTVCFLDKSAETIVSLFLAPLYLILAVSMYFFVRVSLVVITAKKQSANSDYWKRQMRAVMTIATVTGIAWIIAPFLIFSTDATYLTVLQWIFNIVLGLQGVVVFLVQVVLAEEVRNCWLGVYKGSTLETFVGSVLEKQFGTRRSASPMDSVTKSQKLDDITKDGSSYIPAVTASYIPAVPVSTSNGNKLTQKPDQSTIIDHKNPVADLGSSSREQALPDEAEPHSDIFPESDQQLGEEKDSWVKFVEKVETESDEAELIEEAELDEEVEERNKEEELKEEEELNEEEEIDVLMFIGRTEC